MESWAYRHASLVTAVTEGIRTTLTGQKGVPPGKVLFLPNGVDLAAFRPLPPDGDLAAALGLAGQTVVISAGTIGYAAGLDVALDAAALLSERPITFLLVGGGSEQQRLERAARDRGLDNVRFLGPRPSDEIAALYSIATVGITTRRDSPLLEGTRPARILATMACAKPVVYSGSGEGARMVERADAGVVVPPQDPEALATAILALIDDPVRAERMGQNGRRLVETELTWDALVGTWLDELTSRMAESTQGGKD